MKQLCNRILISLIILVIFLSSCSKKEYNKLPEGLTWSKIDSDIIKSFSNGLEIYVPDSFILESESNSSVYYSYIYGDLVIQEADLLGFKAASNTLLKNIASTMIETIQEAGYSSVKAIEAIKVDIDNKESGHVVIEYKDNENKYTDDIYLIDVDNLIIMITFTSIDKDKAYPYIEAFLDRIRINTNTDNNDEWIECNLNTYSGNGYKVFVPSSWNKTNEITKDNSELYLTGKGYLSISEYDDTEFNPQDQIVIDKMKDYLLTTGLDNFKFDIERKIEIDSSPAFFIQGKGKGPEGETVLDSYIFKANKKIINLCFYTFDRNNYSETINDIIERIKIEDTNTIEDVNWIEYKDMDYTGEEFRLYIPDNFIPSYENDTKNIASYDFDDGNILVVSILRNDIYPGIDINNYLYLDLIKEETSNGIFDKPKYTLEKNYSIGNTVGNHIRTSEEGNSPVGVKDFVCDIYSFDTKNYLNAIIFYSFNRYNTNDNIVNILSKVKVLEPFDGFKMVDYQYGKYSSNLYKVKVPDYFYFQDEIYVDSNEENTRMFYILELDEQSNIDDPTLANDIIQSFKDDLNAKVNINEKVKYNDIDFLHLQFEGKIVNDNDIMSVYIMDIGLNKISCLIFIEEEGIYNKDIKESILNSVERK